MVHGKCSHYEMIRTKLKQIHAAVTGDSNIVESGFEDIISSADSIAEVSAFISFFDVFCSCFILDGNELIL